MWLLPGRGIVPSGDARGQSAPIGVALILGIVVVGTVSVLVFGGIALDDTQTQSELSRAEQIMTLFDSRTAMVALGDSDVQTTDLPGGGTHTVDGDAGRIRLVHDAYNGSGTSETLYNDTMGALIYESGNTEFAYQGGGVWRKDRSGDARMVTPPEFHYRQSTLTFPLVRIANDDSAAGGVTATAEATERARPIYPNRSIVSDPPGDEVGAPYDPDPVSGHVAPYNNPVENGTLAVYVTSEYYEGWATYFRQRTEANVTYEGNQTIKADLVSLGERGPFDMPQEGNSLTVRGLTGAHALSEFRINVSDSETQADLNNLQWSMFASEGNQQLELGLSKSGGGNPCGDTVSVSLYYSPDGGSTQHAWQNDNAFTVGCGDMDGDGEEDAYVEVNFTSDDVNLTYEASNGFNSKGLVEYGNDYKKNNVNSTVTWDEHDTVPYESINISDGESMSFNDTVNHYFGLLGEEFDLEVNDQQGGNGNGGGPGTDGSISETASGGFIDYPGNSKYIAYLHVTENEVTVSFS